METPDLVPTDLEGGTIDLLPAGFTPSAQQQAFYDWFRDGKGNLVGRARAGTGKTSTIIQAISHAPESRILLAAFNKRIQEELAARLSNPKAKAFTLHSVGFRTIREFWPGVKVADGADRANDLAQKVAIGQRKGTVFRVAKLLTKVRELKPHTILTKDVIEIAAVWDLLPEPKGQITALQEARLVLEGLKLAAAEQPHTTGIDFADMIFLPLRNGWLKPIYDLVVVDEAQDMSAPQLEIAQKVCAGRMVLIGDDRQAIYGFRGADSGALDRMKAELKAAELGLSITYRCPSKVVEIANRWVDDITAAPSAPAGIVDDISTLDVLAQRVQPGDFVLSRKNAPLMKVAMYLLKQGIPTRIQGKDIGAGLASRVRRLGYPFVKVGRPPALPLAVFYAKLKEWLKKKADHLTALGKEDKIEIYLDQVDMLRALAENVDTVPELEAKIASLFGDKGSAQVICSSVHKAKGLESDHVFILAKTLHPTLPCAGCKHWHCFGPCKQCECSDYHTTEQQRLEEDNIAYVAVTRVKKHLTWLHWDDKGAAE